MQKSFLSSEIERSGRLLINGAADRISDYNSRFSNSRRVFDTLLKQLIVHEFDYEAARLTALEFFGTEEIRFAGVDGTMYSTPMFDLIIFFGGAYTSTGRIEIGRSPGQLEVSYDDDLIHHGRGVSSCVPVYVNEVLEIEPSLEKLSSLKPLDDRAVFDNTRIADWIMAFSEFYLAYKLISEDNVRLLLMDRSLSGEHSALISDTARAKHSLERSALVGFEVDGHRISERELTYVRHRYINSNLDLPPPRGDTLRYRLLYLLEQTEELTIDEICRQLRLNDDEKRDRVLSLLEDGRRHGYFERKTSAYRLATDLRGAWPRLKKATQIIGDSLFSGRDADETSNPMLIYKGGRPTWLTTVDLAFLILVTLYMIIEEAWAKRILLIGLTKDTAARDLKRQLLPICLRQDVWKRQSPLSDLEKIPNTDRMFLQSMSMLNSSSLPIPWALIEYDTSFKTMVPELRDPPRDGFVSGAVKNRISPERLFLKSYIQLSQASVDPKLRSNVLLMDRLVHDGYDDIASNSLAFCHEYGSVIETIRPVLFTERTHPNPMQNLIMTILASMSSSNIPEAFGHNKALFIADNVAKWHYREFKRIVDSTRHWIMSNPRLREFVFYMSTFRERRSEIEAVRRETV